MLRTSGVKLSLHQMWEKRLAPLALLAKYTFSQKHLHCMRAQVPPKFIAVFTSRFEPTQNKHAAGAGIPNSRVIFCVRSIIRQKTNSNVTICPVANCNSKSPFHSCQLMQSECHHARSLTWRLCPKLQHDLLDFAVPLLRVSKFLSKCHNSTGLAVENGTPRTNHRTSAWIQK